MGENFDRVCFQDGWHYSVKDDGAGGETPDERLVLDDDGTYRAATDADTESWHDRKHQRFATVEMEDGAASTRVTPDEYEAIQQLLRDRRGE